MIKKIYFIVKPIGQKKIKRLKKVIFTEANKFNFQFKILNSTHKGHAILLAKKSVDEKANAVIACGGDGTINEIAGILMGKKIPLGIIPIGSGNGIAGHFNIPSNLSEAINIIVKGYDVKVDVGHFNDSDSFFNYLSNLFRMVRHGSLVHSIMILNHSEHARMSRTRPSLSSLFGSNILLQGSTPFVFWAFGAFSLFNLRFRNFHIDML